MTEVTFIKLRAVEKRKLEAISRRRKHAGLPFWSVSSILREAFVAALESRKPLWLRPR